METIELTPAELELIRIKREEQVLADQKREAERQAKQEKEIANIRKTMIADGEKQTKLNEAAKALFVQLGAGYMLTNNQKTNNYELFDYVHKKDGSTDYDRKDFYFQEQMVITAFMITHVDSGATVRPVFYTSGKRYDKNTDIRFAVSGTGTYDRHNDHLKSAKTIKEKIEQAHQGRVAKEASTKAKLEGIEWLLDHVKSLYPSAEVKKDQHSGSYGYKNRYVPGSEYVKTTFTNGLVLEFGFKTNEQGALEATGPVVRIGSLSKENQAIIVEMFAK